MCADIHCICLRFIFNKALSAAPNTLDSDDRALLSVSEFSYAQCLWISSAVLRELTYACWRFHLPVCHRTPLSLSFPSVARDLCGCYRTTQSSRGKPLSGAKLPAVWAWPIMQCRGPKETPFFSLSRSILIRSQCSTFFHMTVITLISLILKPSKLPTHTVS